MTFPTSRPQVTELKMTAHASTRRQQRGIADGVMEAVLAFGDAYRAGDGCIAYFLGEQAVRRHAPSLRRVADRARNVAVVVSGDGAVVTVQHVPRPKKYWRAA
ncbi:MAG: hypothetical protein KF699_14360 [Phycisphaeraceae bacterium]|nr:hypothetical protein [Phycisphaeraceae bacterium]